MGTDLHRVLASDAEREAAVHELNAAFADGRLDAEELDHRVNDAFAARTQANLAVLLADLPPREVPVTQPPERRPFGERVAHTLAWCVCCGHGFRRDGPVDGTTWRSRL